MKYWVDSVEWLIFGKFNFQFYSGSRIKECRRIYDLQEQRNKEMEILLEKKRKDQVDMIAQIFRNFFQES